MFHWCSFPGFGLIGTVRARFTLAQHQAADLLYESHG